MRLFYRADLAAGASGDGNFPVKRELVSEADANLVSSLCDDGRHMPVLDIDRIPVRIVESSTPGNSHLYIDHPMSWPEYKMLLSILGGLGILEAGYVRASIEREATFVRKPGVRKGD